MWSAGNAESRAARSKLHGRVLVVDDEPSVAEFMRELLDSWGLEASVAGEPEAALLILRANADGYDLVITDQTMPQMSGLQLAEEIGRMSPAPPSSYIPVTKTLLTERSFQLPESGLVRKPLDPSELRAVITGYLKQDSPKGYGGKV